MVAWRSRRRRRACSCSRDASVHRSRHQATKGPVFLKRQWTPGQAHLGRKRFGKVGDSLAQIPGLPRHTPQDFSDNSTTGGRSSTFRDFWSPTAASGFDRVEGRVRNPTLQEVGDRPFQISRLPRLPGPSQYAAGPSFRFQHGKASEAASSIILVSHGGPGLRGISDGGGFWNRSLYDFARGRSSPRLSF